MQSPDPAAGHLAGKSEQLLLSNLSLLDAEQREYLLQTPTISTFLASPTKKKANPNDFETIIARSGQPILKWRGKNLHSRIDPILEASRRHANVELIWYKSIVYLGGDLLYSLDALDAISVTRNTEIKSHENHENHEIGSLIGKQHSANPNPKPYGHLLVIFLNDDFLLEVLNSRFLGILNRFKSVQLVSLTDRTRLEKCLSTYVESPHLILSNKVVYQAAQDLVRVYTYLGKQLKNQTSTFFTRYYFEKRWMKNCLHNFSSSNRAYSISCLVQSFQGSDAVLVGAGISLAEHIPTLQEIYREQSAQIIAVDTALPVLLESGVTPDFVIALDGGYYNAGDFARLPGSKTSLITYPHLYPSVIRDFHGKVFFFTFAESAREYTGMGGEGVGIVDEILREWAAGGRDSERHAGILPKSGNVSVAAAILLKEMGFERVTFTGIDFNAYFFSNHPPSTIHYNYYLKNQNRFTTMETMEFEETYFRMSHEEIEQFQKNWGNSTSHTGTDDFTNWGVSTFLWNESATQLQKYIHQENSTNLNTNQHKIEWRQLTSVCSKKTTLEITPDELLSSLRARGNNIADSIGVFQKQPLPPSLYEHCEIIRFIEIQLKRIHKAQDLLQAYWNAKNDRSEELDTTELSHQAPTHTIRLTLSKELADLSSVIGAVVKVANTKEVYAGYSAGGKNGNNGDNSNEVGVGAPEIKFPFREVNNTLAMMAGKLMLAKKLLREEAGSKT